MMHTPLVMQPPDGPWMRRLREGDWLWLVKEQEYALAEFPWQPPEPGHRAGRLVLVRLITWDDGSHVGPMQKWYVGSRGEGLDGKQLVMPCEGHLSDTMVEILDRRESEFLLRLEAMERRIDELSYRVMCLVGSYPEAL